MSENQIEWFIVWTFFLLVTGLIFIEAVWLSRKGWVGFGKAFVFSALTNIIGFSIGLLVVFIGTAVIFMIIFDNSVKKFPAGDYGLAAILTLTVLFVPLLLVICKRFFLLILKIQIGRPAWIYSLVSSVLILAMSLGIPFIIAYFSYR